MVTSYEDALIRKEKGLNEMKRDILFDFQKAGFEVESIVDGIQLCEQLSLDRGTIKYSMQKIDNVTGQEISLEWLLFDNVIDFLGTEDDEIIKLINEINLYNAEF